MSDLRLIEKMRQIEQAAKTEDQVPEKAKRIGLILATIAAIFILVSLFTLAILAVIGGNFFTAITLFVLVAGFSFICWNVYRAPKLP